MLELFRFGQAQGGDQAETLGELRVVEDGEEVYSCCALELPDRDNEQNVSRIPDGIYVCEQVQSSPAFDYPHFWIHGRGSHEAAGRLGVKIHVANYVRQLRGCIAPGQSFRDLDGDGLLDVTHSEETLKELLTVLPTETTLTIRDLPAESATPVEPAELEALDAPIEPTGPIEDVH